MSICVIGINHKTANTEDRERFTVAETDYQEHIGGLINHTNIEAAAIISTCNRTEYYLVLQNKEKWQETVATALNIDMSGKQFYHHFDGDCASHLFAVAAGVDSLVIGETQIQGQVKRAYEASHAQAANSEMSQVFQMAFKTAKAVRSDTEIGRNPVSVAHCAVQLSRQIFGALSDQNILIVGAGETAELILRYLINHGAEHISVTNRTTEKATNLARFFSKQAFELDALPQRLSGYDLVFTATASPTALIDKAVAEQAIKTRKHKPMVMIDLSVPRDIDPKIQSMDDVFLYAVDDLQKVITENMQKRHNTIESAMRIIDAEAELFTQWQKRQRHHDLLKQLQDRYTKEKEALLYKQMPKDLTDKQAQKINTLAHQITQKLGHESITALRKVIESGDENNIKMMAQAFDLKWNENNNDT